MRELVSSWGLLTADPHEVHALSNPFDISTQLAQANAVRPPLSGLAQGMGRSYGDVGLNPFQRLWTTRGLNKFISFDTKTGRLACEAGVTLREIQRLTLPYGWLLAVTPGTEFITVGGAIANDVHGKNHHMAGSFGNHVNMLHLYRSDGQDLYCGPTHQADWFAATLGGLGLTGIIAEVELQLQKVEGPWLETETLSYHHIDEFFHLSESSKAWEQTVSWFDCVHKNGQRGLFMRARPAYLQGRPRFKPSHRSLPFTPPFSLVNSLSLKAFNCSYYAAQKMKNPRQIQHYEPFSYPLDGLAQWNKIYGPKGFYQYQCLIPSAVERDATAAILREIAHSGEGSFLAVLKKFGPKPSLGLLSFPKPGVTLALDFPNRGLSSHRLFERFDAIIAEAGGRIYMAKDARMPAKLFVAGYPNLHRFLQFRDPGLSSGLSRRLIGS